MRLKSLVCALVIMAVPASAMAEEDAKTSKSDDPREVGTWTYGVKGGLTLGTMTGTWVDENTLGDDATTGLHQGVSLGGFGTWYINSSLALQPELYLSEKGVDFEDPSIDVMRNEGLLYIELPVLAKYSFPVNDMIHAYGVGGLAFGYLIDSKLVERDELKKYAVGGVVGIGGDLKLGKHLVILEFRFNEGFLNTLDLKDPAVEDQKARNRVISFLLGFST